MYDSLRIAKLNEVYTQHGKIIIGVDFDDTIFPLNSKYEDICSNVRLLLREAKVYSTICLYTVADEQSIKYKVELMRLWGIEPDYINESPIKLGNGVKPYFNLLLDDKAGLHQAFEVLKQFNNQL